MCPNAVGGDTDEGGKHPGKYSRCFAFSDRGTGGGKLCVRYARGVWRTNGLRIRIRLVVLSNFHVESIFIRATVYFLLIFKVSKHFLNHYLFNSNIIQNSACSHQHDISMTSSVNGTLTGSN